MEPHIECKFLTLDLLSTMSSIYCSYKWCIHYYYLVVFQCMNEPSLCNPSPAERYLSSFQFGIIMNRNFPNSLPQWPMERNRGKKYNGKDYRSLVKAMVFSVAMYGCESWTIKKAERQIIDKRLLRVPSRARRWKQSILKEISPEYSLEGLIWKLKLQYFGHLMWRTDSFEKTLMMAKIEGRRRRGW